ncbi:hypothetical protein J3E07_001653 [Methanococcus voltae]|uniref:Uncharacterized protein n=1 Tax=Methanococcus voltae TaxID=2188 RepID=A0A8J7UT40_METVO|nr:hypothetical protein [Methanococcus voltae]MBP2202212.1 hypothetical protein [Methanococcus voltae]
MKLSKLLIFFLLLFSCIFTAQAVEEETIYYYFCDSDNLDVATVKIDSLAAQSSITLYITENNNYQQYNDSSQVFDLYADSSNYQEKFDIYTQGGTVSSENGKIKINAPTSLSSGCAYISSKEKIITKNSIVEIAYDRTSKEYAMFQVGNTVTPFSRVAGVGLVSDGFSGRFGQSCNCLNRIFLDKTYRNRIKSFEFLDSSNNNIKKIIIDTSSISYQTNNNPMEKYGYINDTWFNLEKNLIIGQEEYGDDGGALLIKNIKVKKLNNNVAIEPILETNRLKVIITNNNDYAIVNYQADIDISKLQKTTNNLKVTTTNEQQYLVYNILIENKNYQKLSDETNFQEIVLYNYNENNTAMFQYQINKTNCTNTQFVSYSPGRVTITDSRGFLRQYYYNESVSEVNLYYADYDATLAELTIKLNANSNVIIKDTNDNIVSEYKNQIINFHGVVGKSYKIYVDGELKDVKTVVTYEVLDYTSTEDLKGEDIFNYSINTPTLSSVNYNATMQNNSLEINYSILNQYENINVSVYDYNRTLIFNNVYNDRSKSISIDINDSSKAYMLIMKLNDTERILSYNYIITPIDPNIPIFSEISYMIGDFFTKVLALIILFGAVTIFSKIDIAAGSILGLFVFAALWFVGWLDFINLPTKILLILLLAVPIVIKSKSGA